MNASRLRAHANAASGAWSTAAFQFLAGVIVVRSLTPPRVGTFVLGVAIAGFIFGIFDIRIEEGLTQLLVRDKAAGLEGRVRPALRYALIVDLVSGAVILALVLGALLLLPLDLNHQTANVAAIAAMASFLGVSDGSFAAVLYTNQAFGWLSAYQAILNGGRCIALLVIPIGAPVDAAWAMVFAQVAATTFLVAATLLQFLPPPQKSGATLPTTDRRWLLRFSMHVALGSALATVRATAIPLVIGAVGARREVANARVAESPTKLLGVAASPLRTVLFPRLSAAWAQRNLSGARRLIHHYVAASLLLGGALGVAMAATMSILLAKIYGAAYGHLGEIGRVFLLAALLDGVAGWQKVAPAALDRPWLRTLILLAESTALLISLLILVPMYGALGAAISATVAGAVSLTVGSLALRSVFTEDKWQARRASAEPGAQTVPHRT